MIRFRPIGAAAFALAMLALPTFGLPSASKDPAQSSGGAGDGGQPGSRDAQEARRGSGGEGFVGIGADASLIERSYREGVAGATRLAAVERIGQMEVEDVPEPAELKRQLSEL